MQFSQLGQVIYDHRFSIGAGLWYVISAAIVTMPGKDEPFHFYPWFFDFTHQFLNLKPIAGLSDRLPAGSVRTIDAHQVTVTPGVTP